MKYPLSLLTVFLIVFLLQSHEKKHEKYISHNLNTSPVQISDTSLVDSFYILNQNRHLWTGSDQRLNKNGNTFLEIIKNARYYGLEPEYYGYHGLQKLSDQLSETEDKEIRKSVAERIEKQLSLIYFKMGKDLNYGRIDSVEAFTRLPRKEYKTNLLQYLQKAVRKDSLMEYLIGLQPSNPEYRKLQKALVQFLEHTELSDEKVKVDQFRTDSVKSYQQARKALLLHNYIPDTEISDSLFLEALKNFQYDHGLSPDGIIGKYTAGALSKSTFDYYQDAAASMERWRWKTPWKKDFLFVNIPAFYLKYYLNDSLQGVYRVVVGKRSRKTPEVNSKLNYLVAYPYWHVPKSISVNEILVHAKEDPEYLKRNRYEVFTKRLEPVEPGQVKWDTVNSKNFNFYIRQKGGTSNALGLVKFIFKNRYSIYLHDTPTKRHFKKDIRAYSHGCVRVQNALELADRVLRFDENVYNKDSIEVFVKRKIEKKIELNKEISVYIYYITCDTDAEGKLIFHYDVYNRDRELKKLLFRSPS